MQWTFERSAMNRRGTSGMRLKAVSVSILFAAAQSLAWSSWSSVARDLSSCLFYQAEDGIRDIGVTGVQTCALPIYTHRQALEAGVRIHGCTVHFVVPELDSGPIVAQAAVPVFSGDTEETLASRVLAQERSEELREGKERRSRWEPYH